MNIMAWPSVLALPIKEFIDQNQPVVKLWKACDVIELGLRLLVALGLGDLRAEDKALSKKLVGEFKDRVEMPTLGKWQGMAGAVAARILARSGTSTVPELAPTVLDELFPLLNGPPDVPVSVETSFKALRNQLAHGGGLSQALAKELAGIWTPRVHRILERLVWLEEMDFLVQYGPDGRIGCLKGPFTEPGPCPSLGSEMDERVRRVFEDGTAVLFLRQGEVRPLWPLILYDVPRNPAGDKDRAGRAVPQIYLRRGPARMEMTPIGSEDTCQSVADEHALNAFLRLFRLDEADRKPTFQVRGFEAEIGQDADRLVGRAMEIRILAEALKEAVLAPGSESGRKVLWVSGEAGIGKSLILAYAAEQLERPGAKIRLPEDRSGTRRPPVSFPQGTRVMAYRFQAGDDRCSMLSFLTFVLERISDPGRDPELARGTDEEKKRKYLARLERLLAARPPEEGPLVFILDGLEEIADEEPGFAEEVPLALSFPAVVWLCAGRPTGPLSQVFSPDRCRTLFPEGLRMTTDDVRAMLLEGLAAAKRDQLIGQDRELGDKVLNPFIERVALAADGLPIYVHYLIEDIAQNRLTDFDEHSPLPASIAEYHQRLIHHLALDGAWYITPHLTAILAVAKEPLSVEALADLLVRGHQLPPDDEASAMVKAGLAALGSVVSLATTPQEEKGFTIFHRSFRQHLGTSPDTRAPMTLARYNLCRLALVPGGRDKAAAPYLYRWGVSHLLETGRREEAVGLMTDFGYLMERLLTLSDPSGAAGIGSDWNQILREGRLSGEPSEWEEFWRTRGHLLLRGNREWPGARILLQLAWEHAAQSPVSRAAEAWIRQVGCDWDWLRLKPDLRPTVIEKGSLNRILQGHTQEVTSVAVSQNGHQVLSGSFGGELHVWNGVTGELLKSFSGHTGLIKPIALSAEDDLAVTASFDKTVGVWDLKAMQRRFLLAGHQKAVLDVKIGPGGRLAASAGQDRTIRIWDLTEGLCVWILKGHRGLVRNVAFLDDHRLVSASLDRTVRLWDLETGAMLRILKGHQEGVTALAAMGTDRLASSSRDGAVLIWNLNQTEPTPLALAAQGEIVDQLAFSPEGDILISSGWDQVIRTWDATSGRMRHELTGHRAKIEALAVASGGRRLLSGSADGSIRVWDLDQGRLLNVLEGNTGGVLSVAAAERAEVAVSGGADKAVGIWALGDTGTGERLNGHQGHLLNAVSFPELGHVVSTEMNGILRVWNQEDGGPLKVIEAGTRWYLEASMASGQDILALVTEASGDFSLWSLLTDRRLRLLSRGLGILTSVGMSPDRAAAFGVRGRNLLVWDLESGAVRHKLTTGKVTVTEVLSDWRGRKLALGMSNGGIMLWSLDQGAELGRARPGRAEVKALAWAPEPPLAAIITGDGVFSLLDTNTLEIVHQFSGLPGTTERLALEPGGQTAVTLGPDLIIRVWDLDEGGLIASAGLTEAPRELPEAYTLLFPVYGNAEACVSVQDELGLLLHRPGLNPVVWVAGYTWFPLVCNGPAVFERHGSVSVLRSLDLVPAKAIH